MSKTFTITEKELKNLINDYVRHKSMCKWCKENIDEDELPFDVDYTFHSACCVTAENWMKSIGINPDGKLSDIVKRRISK